MSRERIIDNFLGASTAPREHAERLDAEPGAFKIGIIGRIAPENGHDLLLGAMGRLRHRNIRLYIFGTGPSEEAYREECANADLENVSFMGSLDDNPRDLGQLDVLAVPWECAGLPFVQALAGTVTTIATRDGGLVTTLADGTTALLVSADDVEGLAHAIEHAADNHARIADSTT